MSGNVWNHPSGSFMVDMGISSNIMKSPSPKCHMTLWDVVIYSDTLNWSIITPIFEPNTELDLITNFDLITKFREVSIEHCNGCGQPTEDAYSSGHLVLSHLGLAFVLMLRPFFPELVMSTDLLSFEHPSVLLFCLQSLFDSKTLDFFPFPSFFSAGNYFHHFPQSVANLISLEMEKMVSRDFVQWNQSIA